MIVADLQADTDRDDRKREQGQQAEHERHHRAEQTGRDPGRDHEHHRDECALDAADDQERQRRKGQERASHRKQEQPEEGDAVAEADRAHVRAVDAQDLRQAEPFEQRRVQEVEAEAVLEVDRHVAGGPHLRFPDARMGRLELVEAPERVAVSDGQPDIAERKFDIAADDENDRERHQERRGPDLEGRGRQQRELKQEQRQHDVAQVHRRRLPVLDEADREIQPHHREGDDTPAHDPDNFGRLIPLAEHVEAERRQPHDGADQKIITLDEIEIGRDRHQWRQDRDEQVLEEQDEDRNGRRVGRNRQHDGDGDEDFDGERQHRARHVQERNEADRRHRDQKRRHQVAQRRWLGRTGLHGLISR
ncbi:hypothetical protein ACU4GH_27775 [Bradyrhizobium betae]